MKKGDIVEISPTDEGFVNCWFVATLLDVYKKRGVYVEYRDLHEEDNESVLQKEYLPLKNVRPVPPEVDPKVGEGRKWNAGDGVEVLQDYAWWRGVITEVLEEDKYKVLFLNGVENETGEIHAEFIRTELKWNCPNNWQCVKKEDKRNLLMPVSIKEPTPSPLRRQRELTEEKVVRDMPGRTCKKAVGEQTEKTVIFGEIEESRKRGTKRKVPGYMNASTRENVLRLKNPHRAERNRHRSGGMMHRPSMEDEIAPAKRTTGGTGGYGERGFYGGGGSQGLRNHGFGLGGPQSGTQVHQYLGLGGVSRGTARADMKVQDGQRQTPDIWDHGTDIKSWRGGQRSPTGLPTPPQQARNPQRENATGSSAEEEGQEEDDDADDYEEGLQGLQRGPLWGPSSGFAGSFGSPASRRPHTSNEPQLKVPPKENPVAIQAYRKVIDTFLTENPSLSASRNVLLADIRSVLQISEYEHFDIITSHLGNRD